MAGVWLRMKRGNIMRVFLLIYLIGLVISPLYSQNANIEDFLSKANSIDVRFDTLENDFIVRRIDVTKESLIVDGEEMIKYSNKNTELLTDSLLKYKQGELIRVERDSTIEYYKTVKVDSVLCMRFAIISIPLNDRTNIDSIYSDLIKQMGEGAKWNDLKYHPVDSYYELSNMLKGQSNWIRSSDIFDSFRVPFLNHEPGDVFIVKNKEKNFAWMVYKTDKEKLFERKQILLVITRKY